MFLATVGAADFAFGCLALAGAPINLAALGIVFVFFTDLLPPVIFFTAMLLAFLG
jgi:hypothetical protein